MSEPCPVCYGDHDVEVHDQWPTFDDVLDEMDTEQGIPAPE